ncbi:MAG: hypothetical protein AAF629_22135, partial [Chloroflexota bacterium]
MSLIPEPPIVLARHTTATGEIQLQHRVFPDGSGAFEIISDGVFLMSSQFHLGEQVLAQEALANITACEPVTRSVLVGGLGMGFTLQEALNHDIRQIDVVEISDHVIDWNRQYFTQLNNHGLTDPRTTLVQRDLYAVLEQSQPASYAAIMLDVDNGPSWLVHQQNDRLYSSEALASWSTLLRPNGTFAVWAAQAEPSFMKRMERHFHDV